jgi:hypothetical protein
LAEKDKPILLHMASPLAFSDTSSHAGAEYQVDGTGHRQLVNDFHDAQIRGKVRTSWPLE